MASTAAAIRRELHALADPAKAAFLQRYFKTGPGEYGEGDRFLGIKVPDLRRIARVHRAATLPVLRALLRSKWHEERALALVIMAMRAPESVRALAPLPRRSATGIRFIAGEPTKSATNSVAGRS